MGIPSAQVVVAVQSVSPMPDDSVVHGGGATGAEFSLWVQSVNDITRQVGTVTLGEVLPAHDAAALHFTIDNDWGGVRPFGVLNDARVVVYAASQAGRSLRSDRR